MRGEWDKLAANGRNVVIMTSGQEGSARDLLYQIQEATSWGRPGVLGGEPVQVLAALAYGYFNFSKEINCILGATTGAGISVLTCLYILKMISIQRQIFHILDAGMIARRQTVFFKAIRV